MGGFTTVQSVGAVVDGAVRDHINRGLLPGPRMLTSLRQINDQSGDPEALRALVRQTKAEGADVIKLFATTGLGAGGNQSMTNEQIRGDVRRGQRPSACVPSFTPSATRGRALPLKRAARSSSTGRFCPMRRSI